MIQRAEILLQPFAAAGLGNNDEVVFGEQPAKYAIS
jgi:hypothetical protein